MKQAIADFGKYDENEDGELDEEELDAMFTKCGITLSTPQVRQIIAYCDADRNGQVSLKELKWLLLNPDSYDAEFNDPPDLKRWLQKEFQPVAAEPERWKKFLIVLYKSLAPVRSIRTPSLVVSSLA